MKKIFPTLIALFAITQVSYAQWTGGPVGNIYYNGGNVGIGIVTPSQPLHIAKDGGTLGMQIAVQDLNTTNAGVGYFGVYQGNTFIQSATLNKDITFFDLGNERMRIQHGGNFGIGTASPTAKLQANYLFTDPAGVSIQGGPSSGTALTIGGSAGDSGASVISVAPNWNTNASPYALDISPAGTANGIDTRLLNISFAGSNKMVVMKGGNVGNGTTSPLTVQGSTGQGIQFTDGSISNITGTFSGAGFVGTTTNHPFVDMV